MVAERQHARLTPAIAVLLLLGASAIFSGVTALQITKVEAQTAPATFTLASPNAQAYGGFGESVAISGSDVVVGAPYETVAGNQYDGRAYVFSTTGTSLVNLTSPNPQKYGNFGDSVAISGSDVVVGAPGEEVAGNQYAGHAYVFSTTGSLLKTLTSLNPQVSGSFGNSVAISGSDVVVGANYETFNGWQTAGRAYVFSPTSTTTSVSCTPTSFAVGSTTVCTATVSGSSPTGTTDFSATSGPGVLAVYHGQAAGCTLSSGSCSVTLQGAMAGSVTIKASYGGDSFNQPSSGSLALTVTSPSHTNYYLWAGIAAAVVVVIAIAIFVMRSRGRRSLGGGTPAPTVAQTAQRRP